MAQENLCKDCPDSLQDLCIFYCMNNLDVLVESLNNIQVANHDTSAMFSMLLGNKMLDYFLHCCLPSDDKEKYVDQLLQNDQLCNELCITRRDMLNAGNLQELANNSIRKLQLSVFDEDCNAGAEEAYKLLFVNCLAHLTSVSLYQKCEEVSASGFLNLLCGEDFWEEREQGKGCSNYSGAAGDSSGTFKVVVANTKYHGFQIKNLVVPATTEAETSCKAGKSVSRSDHCSQILKSFSYEQVYTTIHPDFQPSHSFGWFYHLLSKLLLYNTQLQSFSIVMAISNPVEWFLSQPKLPSLKTLESLCLSFVFSEIAAHSEELDIAYTKTFFANLPVLENLRHLDISCNTLTRAGAVEVDRYCYSKNMVKLFIESVKALPHLKSLDVSGTNLSSIVGHTDRSEEECKLHCMPGFEGRHFDYLGLYGTTDACQHKFIPAHRVSGDASLDQLLVALWSLQHNRAIMVSILYDLQEWAQAHAISLKLGLPMLNGLIAYMAKIGDWDGNYKEATYFEEKSINIILHCIYFLLRNDDVKRHITLRQKRQLMEQLLVICYSLSVCTRRQASNLDQKYKIIRISMLLILILDLESVIVYSYRFEQYIQLLLAVFSSAAKHTLKLLALRLLHSACRFSQELKAIAGGKMQLVKKLLMTVLEKVTEGGEVDEILEKVWSILWTLTDEVPSNCELFVHHAGCQMAKTCIEKYRDAKSLHRKISGAMNNVSENCSLVPQLMTEELVVLFRDMLVYFGEEDYDVSSHAAGFLVMLASHGPKAWTIQEPSREVILKEVEEVMQKWDINKPKGVKFRSLTPMLTQIENFSTPVAQLWGAWLICNLVIIKPHHYCDMLEDENGLTKIDTVLQHGGLQEDLVNLLEKIKKLTFEYTERRARNEPMDESDD